jgi:ribosomal protein S5
MHPKRRGLVSDAWGRRVGRTGLAALVLVGSLTGVLGCGENAEDRFQDAASSAIESGLKSIMDGIITGIFAVATPDSGAGDTGDGT